jgi:hypothetical protein
MPVTSHETVDGPNNQGDFFDGTERYTFNADPGDTVDKTFNAPTQAEWFAKADSLVAVVDLERQQQDAEDAVDKDQPIAANGEASEDQVAVAYIRKGWEEEFSLDNVDFMNQFDIWRQANQINPNQVVAHFAAVPGIVPPLGDSEWAAVDDEYTYATTANRDNVMRDALVHQDRWANREFNAVAG